MSAAFDQLEIGTGQFFGQRLAVRRRIEDAVAGAEQNADRHREALIARRQVAEIIGGRNQVARCVDDVARPQRQQPAALCREVGGHRLRTEDDVEHKVPAGAAAAT